MKKTLLFILLFSISFASAQLNEKMIGKWKMNLTVTTEFTNTESATKQVAANKTKYQYLENSNWIFNKDKSFTTKLKDKKTEKGNYSANEDRFLIIFEKEAIEEFNTTNVVVEDKKVTLSMGRGMTQLKFIFTKK
jgi:hypothetical protein